MNPSVKARRTVSVVSSTWMPSLEVSTSRSSPLTVFWVYGEARPRNHQTDSTLSASQASKSKSSRDLPTPASPITVTRRQDDSSVTSKSRSWRKRSCSSRPTVLVSTPSTPPTRSIWKPVCRSERTTQASTGSSMPLSWRPGRSSIPNAPRIWRRVSRETRIPSTGAAACSRLARLTVGPTATNPMPRRSSSVLTTTSPVSMPTRMCSVTP